MGIDFDLIGKRIQSERKKQGFTQEHLAELLDVSVGYVSQIERGISKPNLEMLAAVSNHLHCDIAYIISGSTKAEESYLLSELSSIFEKLTAKEKNVVLSLMESLINNR
jgi:transcriptional regulator with XRE-family HTH domain